MVITRANLHLDAIQVGPAEYFRGQQFAAERLGSDPVALAVVRAAATGWWKGLPGTVPALAEFTRGDAFRTAFLGAAVTRRTDGVEVGGVRAVELSGRRADVWVASGRPHRVLAVRLQAGVTVDGITGAVFQYGGYGSRVDIAPPSQVIDFSTLSVAPPIYTVLAVDTSACAATCVLAASLKNLGGSAPTVSPSTVRFTVTDPASGAPVGTC